MYTVPMGGRGMVSSFVHDSETLECWVAKSRCSCQSGERHDHLRRMTRDFVERERDVCLCCRGRVDHVQEAKITRQPMGVLAKLE